MQMCWSMSFRMHRYLDAGFHRYTFRPSFYALVYVYAFFPNKENLFCRSAKEVFLLKWHPFYDIIPVRSKRNHDLMRSSFCLEKYMEIKFAYGKCVFTRPRIENVDQMVQMMNNENIASMLSAKRRIITRESELEWIQAHQDDLTFSAYDR